MQTQQSRLEADPDLAVYVAGRLTLLDSPMTIAIQLARGTHGLVAFISHECIYQAIYQRRGLTATSDGVCIWAAVAGNTATPTATSTTRTLLGTTDRSPTDLKSLLNAPRSVTSKAT